MKSLESSDFLEPLDTRNLTLNWPLWKHRFTTNYNQLPDNQKLDLFLDSLGHRGLKIVYFLFPELLEFNDGKAAHLTFEQVWIAFDRYCMDSDAIQETQNLHKMSQKAAKDDLLKDLNPKSVQDMIGKLSAQADKCHFECINCKTSYKDRMVRDHLLAVIGDDEMKNELMDSCVGQSIAQSLKKFEDISNNFFLWSMILPWLSLRDVDALSLADIKFHAIVNRYTNNGNNVIIDYTCCDSDGILDLSLLKKYKDKLTSCTLVRIKESDVQTIFSLFPDITQLTLNEVKIFNVLGTTIPSRIRHLSIINCTISHLVMQDLCNALKKSLEVLFVDHLVYSMRSSDSLILMENDVIHSVTIKSEGVNIKLFLGNLKNLKIIAQKRSSCQIYCPALETLHYDVRQDNTLSCLTQGTYQQSLRSLTIRRWPLIGDLKQFTNLESLRIIQSVEPGRSNILETLATLHNLKTVDIHYWHIPTGANEDNLILKLNEDCLRHILQYLSFVDSMALGSTEPQLNCVVKGFKYPEPVLDLSKWTMERMPLKDNLGAFELMGKFVTTLSLSDIAQEDLFALLPMFHKVKELTITNLTLDEVALANLFPLNLETLNDVFCKFSYEFYEALLRRLNLTLRTLDCYTLDDELVRCLAELHNIRSLTCSAELICPEFLQFLRQNKAQLEEMCMLGIPVAEVEVEISFWDIVREMRQLKCLNTYLNDLNVQGLQAENFPNLEEVFILKTLEHGQMSIYLSNGCPRHIRKLSIPVESDDLGTLIAHRFPDLQELCIRRNVNMEGDALAIEFQEEIEDWMSLCALAKLKKLDVSGLTGLPRENVMQLIWSLPCLVEIWVPLTIPLETVQPLKDFLNTESRNLKVNGVQL